jgi:hypothetical protein
MRPIGNMKTSPLFRTLVKMQFFELDVTKPTNIVLSMTESQSHESHYKKKTHQRRQKVDANTQKMDANSICVDIWTLIQSMLNVRL